MVFKLKVTILINAILLRIVSADEVLSSNSLAATLLQSSQLRLVTSCLPALLNGRKSDHFSSIYLSLAESKGFSAGHGDLLENPEETTTYNKSSSTCAENIFATNTTYWDRSNDEGAESVHNWKGLVASLLADGLGFLILLSCFLTCRTAGAVSGLEYDYHFPPSALTQRQTESEDGIFNEEIDGSEYAHGIQIEGAEVREPLTRKASIVSAVSTADLPHSPRLLYPSVGKAGSSYTTERRHSFSRVCRDTTPMHYEPILEEANYETGPTEETSVQTEYALWQHPHLNCFWRLFTPSMIFVAGIMTVVGLMSDGMLVLLHFQSLGKEIDTVQISDYTLVQSIKDMCSAGVYPLATLVLIWSGVWPIIRPSLMLFTWFAPPRLLSVYRRAALLHILDALGKWCLLNLVMSTLMGVAFSFDVGTDDLKELNKILPNDLLRATVGLKAGLGMTLGLTSALLLLICTHITIAVHRFTMVCDAQLVGSDTEPLSGRSKIESWFEHGSTNETKGARESVSQHMFSCDAKISGVHCCGKCSSFAFSGLLLEVIVGVLLALTLGFIVYSIDSKALLFEFEGLVGKLLHILKPSAQTSEQSMISIIMGSLASRTFNAYYCSICLFIVAIVMPIVHIGSLALMWYLPLTLKELKILYTIGEIAGSWACMDVLLLAMLSTTLQISQFARWMVGRNCPFPDQFHIDCFGVQATMEPTILVLLAAVACWYLIGHIVTRCVDHAIIHREQCLVQPL